MRAGNDAILIRMAPISTGRPVYSCARSTRRKYHGPCRNVASGRSATRPPKWRSSVIVMSVRCTSSERYGSGMSSGAIARTCGSSTPDRAYTKSSGKSIPADGLPRLRVPDAGMFRLKEPRKERVDAQKTIAAERDDVAARLVEETVRVERGQWFGETG